MYFVDISDDTWYRVEGKEPHRRILEDEKKCLIDGHAYEVRWREFGLDNDGDALIFPMYSAKMAQWVCAADDSDDETKIESRDSDDQSQSPIVEWLDGPDPSRYGLSLLKDGSYVLYNAIFIAFTPSNMLFDEEQTIMIRSNRWKPAMRTNWIC